MILSNHNNTYDIMNDEQFQNLLDETTVKIQEEIQKYIVDLLLKNNYIYVSQPVVEIGGVKMEYLTANTMEEMKLKIDSCRFKGKIYCFENLFDKKIRVIIN